MSVNNSVKNKLITQAVNKLKKFGFVNVAPENIMLDEVYKFYFDKMLRTNLGRNATWDIIINQLLTELNPPNPKTNKSES